jgi:hypothetical protein
VDQEAVSDVDAAALENEATGAGRPDFPATVTVMSLPRRQRAELFRAIEVVRVALNSSQQESPNLIKAAKGLEATQQAIDGVLCPLAVDEAAMRDWADAAPDASVLRALTWVMRDLGEANGSTGS